MNKGKNEKISKAKTSNTEEFKIKVKKIDTNNEFEVVGEYINSQTNIKMIHHSKEGDHYFYITPNNFLKRKRCNICNKVQSKKTNEEFLDELFKIYSPDDIEVLDKYINNKTPIRIKCKHCNRPPEPKRPVDLLCGNTRGRKTIHKCPCMVNGCVSQVEMELYEFIKSIYSEKIITNSKKILKSGLELDIYLPDIKLAFEFDGLYWHSDFNTKENRNIEKYHLNKTEECEKLGIQLIHIFEDEWENKKDIVKSKIKYLLGKKNDKKIFARKCYIEEIGNEYKNKFLNQNHIQGEDKSNIKLGLWYNNGKEDLLVAVMTFCKPRTSLGLKDSNYDYELSR